MAATLSRIASPTVLLYSFVVVTQVADAFYLGQANRTTGYFHTHSVGGSDLGHGLVVAHRQPQARRRVGLRSRLLSIHRLAGRYALLSSEDEAC